jgi:hypothetical protein
MKKVICIIICFVLCSIFWLPSGYIQASPSNQPMGTYTFDNSNSELGCTVWATIKIKKKDNKGREYETGMILSTSTSKMDENPNDFAITLDFDNNTITGFFDGAYISMEEEEGAYDAAGISASILNGTVIWDEEQSVWMFEGDVEMQVSLDMRNKTGTQGDEILYGEAEFETIVTGALTGASGKHKRLYHDEMQEQEGFLRITYEGDHPDATGNGELRVLNIECWLAIPFGEDMQSKFPSGAEQALSGADAAEEENKGQVKEQGSFQDDLVLSDLNDLNNQLGLFITKYGTDDLDFNLWASKWEGWDKLSQTQKTNLEKIIRRLDTILALEAPLSPMGLAALEGEKRQEVLAQQAADRVQDELDIRKTVRDTVWTETLRDKFGDKGVYIYENYQIFKDVKKVYDSGVKWINNIKDPDAAATEKIKQESLGGTKSPEDIAKDAISYINTIATASSVYHYAYYREVYDKLISGGNNIDEAHQAALDALRKRVKDYNDGEYGNFEDKLQQRVWGPAVESALKPGGVYDNAFRKLVEKDLACPKV